MIVDFTPEEISELDEETQKFILEMQTDELYLERQLRDLEAIERFVATLEGPIEMPPIRFISS